MGLTMECFLQASASLLAEDPTMANAIGQSCLHIVSFLVTAKEL